MDPNANLREQQQLYGATDRADRVRLRELREALQQWLASSGFEPDWAAHPDASRTFREWQKKRRKFQDLYR